ncbi:MAG: hypothetical protein M3391_06245 [Actinomycetota bacterium]|nr:hypothetical protein [Actinomycetota bacterium]
MRGRRAIVLVLVAVLVATVMPAARASSEGYLLTTSNVIVAQEETGAGQDDEGAGQESGGEGEGQDDPEAETGAGTGESEEVEETGPVWTYQMARIVVVLLVLLLAAIGFLYWRLVGQRRRSGVV